jgi:4-amino-4-deoxy-L-arabinose transferase-like glycosyltransferase
MQSNKPARTGLFILALILVAVVGLGLRIYHSAGYPGIGFDENLYRTYVRWLLAKGLDQYPAMVDAYIIEQSKLSYSVLPPMRCNYILVSWAWVKLFGGDILVALKHVATMFTCLSFLLSLVFALRLGDRTRALAVFALMAVAPTQLHMSQHALVDGVFAFWALLCLWLLWENLNHPDHSGWLLSLGLALAAMVTTKENAAFAFIGFLAILAANRWLQFGKVTWRLCATMIVGPFLGVMFLVLLAGGIPELIQTYQLSVSKNFTLPYAIRTGDGPWYRYLVDLMVVSPVILILALGQVFQLNRQSRVQLFFLLFIAASYLVMCNIKFGMNLRYANMWDFPLRILAFGALASLCARIPKRQDLLLSLSTLGICLVELRQYYLFTVAGKLYELASGGLLYAIKILKD